MLILEEWQGTSLHSEISDFRMRVAIPPFPLPNCMVLVFVILSEVFPITWCWLLMSFKRCRLCVVSQCSWINRRSVSSAVWLTDYLVRAL